METLICCMKPLINSTEYKFVQLYRTVNNKHKI